MTCDPEVYEQLHDKAKKTIEEAKEAIRNLIDVEDNHVESSNISHAIDYLDIALERLN